MNVHLRCLCPDHCNSPSRLQRGYRVSPTDVVLASRRVAQAVRLVEFLGSCPVAGLFHDIDTPAFVLSANKRKLVVNLTVGRPILVSMFPGNRVLLLERLP